jgi:hypothetical protein
MNAMHPLTLAFVLLLSFAVPAERSEEGHLPSTPAGVLGG